MRKFYAFCLLVRKFKMRNTLQLFIKKVGRIRKVSYYDVCMRKLKRRFDNLE